MSRYFTKRRVTAHWLDENPMLPHLDVPEHEATDTGIVDKRGDPIMRAPRPIGFGRDREW